MKSIFCTKINNFLIQPSTAASENISKISHNGKIHAYLSKKYLITVDNKNTTEGDMITSGTFLLVP